MSTLKQNKKRYIKELLLAMLSSFIILIASLSILKQGWIEMKWFIVLRAERDWSQADLADRLDVSRQTVNAIETRKYDPSLPLAFRIAQLFRMTIEEIFTPDTNGELLQLSHINHGS